jgi:L-malate glycosyltransferase
VKETKELKEKLRILHIVSGDRWAGAEVMAYTLMKELKKQHDVFAIVLNHGELEKRLQDIGIAVTILDEAKLNSWQIFKGIKNSLKRIIPDVIHTHRQKENILGSIANSLTIRARCVRTVHGDSEFKPKGIAKIQSILDNLCGRYLQQAIIAVSEDLHSKLITKFTQNKVFTIVNGIDPDETRLDLEYPDFKNTMPDKKHIGLIGRLDPVKRIDIFLEMAALLENEHPEIPWHFHIFGEGHLEKEMKQLSLSLNISDIITFHGHRMDIKKCIYGLDAAVMCSDHEGLPMAALESIAIGTPLIAHSVGGLINLMKESFSEFLVTDHKPIGYSKVVYKTIKGKTQKLKYPENYRIDKATKNIIKLYQKISK